MHNRLSVLISSCNNFSDLWDENIKAYQKYWKNNPCDTFLVTDKKTNWNAFKINIIVSEREDSFPIRIKNALSYIKTKYILLTLDDYFLINTVDNQKIEYLVNRMQKENIQYLSLYNRRITKQQQYLPLEHINSIDLKKKYALTLYPAIWEVDFLKKTISESLDPWLYEVSLTKTAIKENANCKESLSGVYDILDVVRKGKVLHKAQRYFKTHGINIGNRPTIGYLTEIKLYILDIVSWYTPRFLFLIIKRMAKILGIRFYSDD